MEVKKSVFRHHMKQKSSLDKEKLRNAEHNLTIPVLLILILSLV